MIKMISIGLLCGLLATVEGQAQEQSTWWHGAYVNAGSSNCDANDSLVSFDAESVQPLGDLLQNHAAS